MPFAAIDGEVLHYRLAGMPGRPRIAFSNSIGSDLRIWDAVAAGLGEDFELLFHDKRGHGLSSAPPGPYTIAGHAADLLGLLDHVGWERASLVGLSVGGLIAQDIAIRSPARVERLVLLDTAARIGGPDLWNARIAAVERDGLAAIAGSVIERWFTPTFAAERPAERAGWLAMLERTPAAGYAGTAAALRDADFTAELGAIRAPTLVAVGEADIATPPDLVRASAEAIPGARFATIEKAGHLPCIEQPDAVVRLIREHMEGADA